LAVLLEHWGGGTVKKRTEEKRKNRGEIVEKGGQTGEKNWEELKGVNSDLLPTRLGVVESEGGGTITNQKWGFPGGMTLTKGVGKN